jgi:hypothetical protein
MKGARTIAARPRAATARSFETRGVIAGIFYGARAPPIPSHLGQTEGGEAPGGATLQSSALFRLRAPRFGGLKPAVAAKSAKAGRAARALRQRARLPALHRGDFGLRDRSFRDADGGLFARPITGLSPRSSCPVQPTEGQSPIVGTDGDPRPPECPADEAEPAGAAPHSANKRHRLTPLE